MTSARAVAVGALAPALGAALHVGAGGGVPELTPALLATGVVVALSAARLSRRRAGAVPLAAVLLAGQLAWHVAMELGPGGHAAMGHGPTTPSPAMLVAHAVAALLVALGVTRADRAVLALVADRIVGMLVVPTGPRPSSGPLLPQRTERRPTAIVLLPTRPLRGPPVRPA